MPKKPVQSIESVRQKLNAASSAAIAMEQKESALVRQEAALENRLADVLAGIVATEKAELAEAKAAVKRKESALRTRAARLMQKKREYEAKEVLLKQISQRAIQIKRELQGIDSGLHKDNKDLKEIKKTAKKHKVKKPPKPKA
ncbi:MAG: hypothetical protein NTW59_04400, partial [Candidatus Diapherotrites archaeon]|nr:hypothetical protein [Candidatus Diapherotrites archaeon]